MSKDSKVGHKGETQTPLNPVAKINYIYKRGAIYYFRMRIPTDLVEAGIYPKKEIKHSLKTKELSRAKRLAQTRVDELNTEFDEQRLKLQAANPIETPPAQFRSLSSLSDLEIRDIIRREFIRLEQECIRDGRREYDSLNWEIPREEAVMLAGQDLAVYEGNVDDHAPMDWEGQCRGHLKRLGITVDDKAATTRFPEFCKLFKMANVESQWRTYSALDGGLTPRRDKYFGDLGFATHLPSTESIRTHTIEDLQKDYVETKEKAGVSNSSLNKYSLQFRIMKELWGKNKALSSITTDDARSLADFLGTVPTNCPKRYPNLTLAKAAKKEASKKRPSCLAPKTQDDYFIGLTAILSHSVDLGWLDRNPLKNKIVTQRLPPVEKTDKPMFTQEDFDKFFLSDIFIVQRNQTTKEGILKQARFWVPLICLFHGSRSNETCQLLVDDIVKVEGIPCISIAKTNKEGMRVKRLKNESSQRTIPIHNELIKMGFLGFVTQQRQRKETFLFPELKANSRGSKADGVGKWFKAQIKKLLDDIPDIHGAKGLHSLRHSFVRALRDAGVADGIHFALGGWSDKKAQQNSAAGYGSGYSMSILKEAIDKVEYSNTAFEKIYLSK